MDEDELRATARIAKLALKPEEVEAFRLGAERMLTYFSHMKELDVEGLAPTTHSLLHHNRRREDHEDPRASSESLLKNAPRRDERFIVVPNVL